MDPTVWHGFGPAGELVQGAASFGGEHYVIGNASGLLPGQSPAGLGNADAFLRKYSASGAVLWTRQFGTPQNDDALGIAIDQSGNIYVTGSANAALPGQIHAGGTDAFLQKLDPNGAVLWTRQFGTPSFDAGTAVAVDATGKVVVAGHTTGAFAGGVNQGSNDVFLRQYDANGNEVSTVQFGTAGYDDALAVTFDTAGGIVVGGRVGGALPGKVHGGGLDAFLRRYDGNGNEGWTIQEGGTSNDAVRALALDPTGNLYAGLTLSVAVLRKYDISGTPAVLWSNQTLYAEIFALDATASGVAVAGVAELALPGQTAAGSNDAFVRLFSDSGTLLWTRQFGSNVIDRALGVALGTAGVFVAGYTDGLLEGVISGGNRDGFVRLYDWDGTSRWLEQFTSFLPGTIQARSVHVTGAIYTAGETTGALGSSGYAGGQTDAFVLKHDLNGSLVWTSVFGTGLRDRALGVSSDADSNVYVGGTTTGSLTGDPVPSSEAAFLRKLSTNGTVLWTRQFVFSPPYPTNLRAVAARPSGDVILAGDAEFSSAQTVFGGPDGFVRRYDASGNLIWNTFVGNTGTDRIVAIAIAPSGDIYAAGETTGTFPGQTKSGSIDAFLSRISANGSLLWTVQTGAGNTTRGTAITVTADGSIYFGGTTNGAFPGFTNAGSADAFVQRYTDSGALLWTAMFGGSIEESLTGLVANGNAGVFASGRTVTGNTGFDGYLRGISGSGVVGSPVIFTSADNRADSPLAASADDNGTIVVAGETAGNLGGFTRTGNVDAFVIRFLASYPPPTLTALNSAIMVSEGGTAVNTGTFSSPNPAATVILSASIGTITQSTSSPGTWSWSLPTTNGPMSPQTVTITANDGQGGSASLQFTYSVLNVAPTVLVTAPSTVNEAQPFALSGQFVDPGATDTHTVLIQWGDGTPNTVIALPPGVRSFSAPHTYADDGASGTAADAYSIAVTVMDQDGGAGTAFAAINVANLAPAVTAVSGPTGAVAVDTVAAVTARISDAGLQDTHTCRFSWDNGTTDTVVAAVGDQCSANHTFTAAGVYSIGITVTDDDTGTASSRFDFVIVYDSSAGFITGGGWLSSPSGAYLPDSTRTGRVNFGFVSRYQPGAQVPTGNMDFHLQAGDFRFAGTEYEWLVIAGARSQVRGIGTVNGVPGYGFLVTAIDGDLLHGRPADRFRIKIWRRSTATSPEQLVYDNKRGDSDDLDAGDPPPIGGGNVTIQSR